MDKKLFRSYLILITFAVVLVLAVINFDRLAYGAGVLLGLLKPFFIGCAIAFVLNIPYVAIQNGMNRLQKKQPRLNRFCAICGAYLLCFGIVGGVIAIVIPELGRSINQFISNSEIYRRNFQNALLWLSHLDFSPLAGFDGNQMIAILEQEWNRVLGNAMEILKVLFPQIFDKASSLVHGAANLLIGLVISVYLLNGKERLCHQVKRMAYALLPEKLAKKSVEIAQLVNQSFSNFISGQLLEACILGFLCFIGMNLFDFEYAFLISLLIGTTAIVPVVGAFIGTVPAVILLFLVDPGQAVWFLVFILILQQIEGHLIYPKVVGESVGLPALWVLMGIVVGGGLGGVLGMLLGVPMFTVLYKLLSQFVQLRLEKKQLQI